MTGKSPHREPRDQVSWRQLWAAPLLHLWWKHEQRCRNHTLSVQLPTSRPALRGPGVPATPEQTPWTASPFAGITEDAPGGVELLSWRQLPELASETSRLKREKKACPAHNGLPDVWFWWILGPSVLLGAPVNTRSMQSETVGLCFLDSAAVQTFVVLCSFLGWELRPSLFLPPCLSLGAIVVSSSL